MRPKSQSLRAGFSLIELMIYVGLTSVVVGLFAGILITATRIQGEETSSANVTQELNFLMTSLKSYVRDSVSYSVQDQNNVLFKTDHGSSVALQFDSAKKLVKMTIDDGQNPPIESILSSSKISIDALTFTDLRQGSSTALQIDITASASTTDPGRRATRTLQSTVSSFLQEL